MWKATIPTRSWGEVDAEGPVIPGAYPILSKRASALCVAVGAGKGRRPGLITLPEHAATSHVLVCELSTSVRARLPKYKNEDTIKC
eukprot:6181928-Pleurochrysis_carterae.AAC.1